MLAKNIIVKAAFELQSLRVFERRSKKVKKHHKSGHQVVFMVVLLKLKKLPITEFICEIFPHVLL